jgi:hypothetical protein
MLETNCLDEAESKRAAAIKLSATGHHDGAGQPSRYQEVRQSGLYNTATGACEIGGESVAHRLFIPMSDIGQPITRHIVMSR